jgi:hypothetical protein
MPDRLIPERISDFLTERPGRRYCDSCIQERLGLRWRQQVQLVTATLAVTRAFERDRSMCCTCDEVKRVITALRAPQGDEVLTERARGAVPVSTDTRHSVKLVLAHR